jgi:hypothetical protein
VCKRVKQGHSVWDVMAEAYADCPVYERKIFNAGKESFIDGISDGFDTGTEEILCVAWRTCEPIKVMHRPVQRWAKHQQMNIDREKRTKAREVILSMEVTIAFAIAVKISTLFNFEQKYVFDLIQDMQDCVDVDANVLLYAFILFVRLENKMQEKGTWQNGSERPKNVERVHLFYSCFYLAVKLLEDRGHVADVTRKVMITDFAKFCGLDKQVYLDLEWFICGQLDWQLQVSVEQYVACIESFESFPKHAEKYAEKKEALLQMFKHKNEAHTAEFAVADPDVNAIARSRPFLEAIRPFPWKRFVRSVYPDSYGSD